MGESHRNAVSLTVDINDIGRIQKVPTVARICRRQISFSHAAEKLVDVGYTKCSREVCAKLERRNDLPVQTHLVVVGGTKRIVIRIPKRNVQIQRFRERYTGEKWHIRLYVDFIGFHGTGNRIACVLVRPPGRGQRIRFSPSPVLSRLEAGSNSEWPRWHIKQLTRNIGCQTFLLIAARANRGVENVIEKLRRCIVETQNISTGNVSGATDSGVQGFGQTNGVDDIGRPVCAVIAAPVVRYIPIPCVTDFALETNDRAKRIRFLKKVAIARFAKSFTCQEYVLTGRVGRMARCKCDTPDPRW